jgi:hypothetical protein
LTTTSKSLQERDGISNPMAVNTILRFSNNITPVSTRLFQTKTSSASIPLRYIRTTYT